MEFNKREVTLYYKPNVKKDKNTYDLAKQLSSKVNDIDVTQNTPNQRMLIEIIDKLNGRVTDLIDKDSDPYKRTYYDRDMSDEDWLLALQRNPDMLYTPIAFFGDRGMLVDTPSRVLDLDPKHGFNDLAT